MADLNATLAPRALTADELASVIAPQLITYGVAKRAFTHASLWDGSGRDNGTTTAAEAALGTITGEALCSLDEWLGDMEQDGEPRFYRKQALKTAVQQLCDAAADYYLAQSDERGVDVITCRIEDREGTMMADLIRAAGRK